VLFRSPSNPEITHRPDELADESQRAELVGQLATAQSALENAITEMARNGFGGSNLGAAQLQLSTLVSLRQHVGFASGAALAALRMEVVAAASSATAVAQQAAGEISAAPGDQLTRAEAARRTIETVGRELFDERVLDPYLKFTSKEDEDAYRKREQERRDAYDRAMALNTPDGNRRAIQISREQLQDAGAHGADQSPDYTRFKQDIAKAAADLETPGRVLDDSSGQLDRSQGPEKSASGSLEGAMAALSKAGVTSAEPSGGQPPHGLNEGLRGRGQPAARV
jgi:hypothetical protein